MATWAEIESEAPDLAERVRRRFALGTNKTMATLRADGSPRISATELQFDDGQVTLGMMGGSVKLADARRDPRVAIHSPTVEAPEGYGDPEAPIHAEGAGAEGAGADAGGRWPGDAKLAGRLVEVPPPADDAFPGSGHFRVDVTEVVLAYLNDAADQLVVESWHPNRGVTRRIAGGAPG
jgi:hypothetical protein